MVVPIWIALSSTVILYNSKSAGASLHSRKLTRSEYLYTNLNFPYVSHPPYQISSFADKAAGLHVRQVSRCSRRSETDDRTSYHLGCAVRYPPPFPSDSNERQ
jgi:hypothetical protein